MSKFKIKNQPSLRLLDLLKRRRTSLKVFIEELGIFTYDNLVRHCQLLGVIAPSIYEFQKAFPEPVTSPTDGVVVIEPTIIEVEEVQEQLTEAETELEQTVVKRRRKTPTKND